ncbi:MAG: helix-turn-helix domain-containing protein [Citromicrobium sp.]
MGTPNDWRYWERATDEEVARTVETADAALRRDMEKGSRALLQAQQRVWPCQHLREGNTHRIGNAVMCKVCRRRRWMSEFRLVVLRRRMLSVITEASATAYGGRFTKEHGPAIRAHYKALAAQPGRGKLTASQLLEAIAAEFDATPEDIRGRSRSRPLPGARSVFTRIMRERGLSFPAIGRLIGGRDHSTLIHLSRMFVTYASRDERVADTYLRYRDGEVPQ